MRVFVAGATGATGSVFVPEASRAGIELVLHVRPRSAARTSLTADPRARAFDLEDLPAATAAMKGCDAVVSFVGTMRSRFAAGDTYASSDLGATRALVEAARAASVPRFLLLSSVGAGGVGAYLAVKAEAEALVVGSGLAATIFRPSVLVTPVGAPVGHTGVRRAPLGAGALFGLVRAVPGLAGVADDYRPIPLDVLARAFVRVLCEPRPGAVLAGRDLWPLGTSPEA